MTLYRERLAAAGHAWQPDQMALMLPVHLGATNAAARDAMRAGVRRYYENLRAIFAAVPASYGEHLPRLKAIEENVRSLDYEKFCRDHAVFGEVGEVVERLQAAREEFGLSQIIAWFDQGNRLPRAEVERAMRRFADEVMPRLA
jgi:alkanesulfonate monooxygenase SsuD/methylene tetrahydromethanopterin reductase-like flavin-dependent oxidoreductase (luciferase family)